MSNFIQLPLSLSYRKAFGRKDFIVAPCNLEAVAWIDKWPNWPTPAVLIYGEHGAGKSHLGSIFSEYKINASDLTDDFLPFFQKKIVVEDLENLTSEVALFHLFNFIRDLGGFLLLTSKTIPEFKLPDLQSRIQAIPKAPITIPDENFVFQCLSQAFKDRQILVDDSVLNSAVRHMERSFNTIQRVIQTADALSLAENRKITIPVIKATLEQIGDSTCDSCQN